MTTALRRIIFIGILAVIWEVTSKLIEFTRFYVSEFNTSIRNLISRHY